MTAYACPLCRAVVRSALEGLLVCGACNLRLERDGASADLPRQADGVPLGLPDVLSLGDAADALGLSPGTLRGRMDRGELEYRQDAPGAWRRILTSELARYEESGYLVEWDKLAGRAA